jgi:aspartate/methionine/tyrosine aminotransferase
MFSRRSHFEVETSPYTVALEEARAENRELIDLTVSNPTACGLTFDPQLPPLDTTRYIPYSLGLLSGREAVAAYYRDHGITLSPENICLTASTSESYSFLFRLLCDPGDEVLIPQPGYPLFDMLAALDSVSLRSYPLLYDHGWQIDLPALEASITPRTRAVIVVHPNNPTGHLTSAYDHEALYALAKKHNLALIVDEVFLDYVFGTKRPRTFADPEAPALTFTLSGLSKVCALPQMKLAWIATTGPGSEEALHRLELIADTFLSVATPAQLALPHWLSQRHTIQRQIHQRVQSNLVGLDRLLAGTSVTRLELDAGWAVILRTPALGEDVSLAAQLLQYGVVTHPGSFYGLSSQGRLVLSLLPREEKFTEGVNKIINGTTTVNAPSSNALSK